MLRKLAPVKATPANSGNLRFLRVLPWFATKTTQIQFYASARWCTNRLGAAL